jgi:hypothetical protein
MVELGGRNAMARLIDLDASYLGRVLSGDKPPSDAILERFRDLRERFWAAK